LDKNTREELTMVGVGGSETKLVRLLSGFIHIVFCVTVFDLVVIA
jgi:hypothetical protein